MARSPNFIDELKRRKVFRLATMYAVAGWIVLQVGEVTFEPLGLPEGSLRALIFFVFLGFPIALALGWIFDWTPGGIERTAARVEDPADRAETESSASTGGRWRRIALVAVALLVAFGVYRGFEFWSQVRWLQDVAQPELVRHIEVNDYHQAFLLAREMESRLGTLPALESVWPLISAPVAFSTDPPGATVSYRDFRQVDGAWTVLGETPTAEVRVPRGPSLWQIEKEGHVTREFVRAPSSLPMPQFRWPEHYVLDREDEVPNDVVAIEARQYAQVSLGGFPVQSAFQLDRSYLDRTEVHNDAYRAFVEAGGYEREEFWREPFVDGERTLSFQEAMARFVDATGRPGPSTWIGGRPPQGLEDHPVAGVSWYEAMAYARFEGRDLPTAYHWAAAALPDIEIVEPIAPALSAQSNLEGTGTEPVGSRPGVSAAGALDMFGNVAEWVSTARGEQERFTLGLGWSDPAYNVSLATAASPWSRLPAQGFRLVDYPSGPPAAELLAPVDVTPVDYESLELLSEEAIALVAPPVEPVSEVLPVSGTNRTRLRGVSVERIEIQSSSSAADPLPLYIIAPEDAAPPHSVVIWYSGLNAILVQDEQNLLTTSSFLDFLSDSGRMIVMPVWTDTFSRNDGSTFRRFMGGGASQRELVSAWAADLGLTIDYLASRDDVEQDAIAFVGLSLGALVGELIVPRNDRIRTAVYWSGGFPASLERPAASAIASLAQRSDQSVLMLNGRYDFVFPLDGQRSYHRFLGAPPEHKRHVVYDAGHFGWPLGEFVRENLDWMDRYLGKVKRSAERIARTQAATTPEG